jgi:hypothetical protein
VVADHEKSQLEASNSLRKTVEKRTRERKRRRDLLRRSTVRVLPNLWLITMLPMKTLSILAKTLSLKLVEQQILKI